MKTALNFGTMPNYSIYTINGKMGLACGFNLLTQPKYDLIFPYKDSHAIVKLNGKYGLIDQHGCEIMPVEYKSISHFEQNSVLFNEGEIFYINDYAHNVYYKKHPLYQYEESIARLLNVSHVSIYDWGDENEKFGYSIFSNGPSNANTGIYVKKTNRIIFNNYNFKFCSYKEDLIIFEKDHKYGLGNFNGEIKAHPVYDFLMWANDGLILAKRDGKCGYLDKDGRIRIPFCYEIATSFRQGKASIRINGKDGLIDTMGNILISPNYKRIEILNNGTIVLVSADSLCEYYDIYGKPPLNLYHRYYGHCDFDFYNNSNLVRINKGSTYGLTTLDGEIILEPKYKFIYPGGGKNMVVNLAGKEGIIDICGNIKLPLRYSYIRQHKIITDNTTTYHYIVEDNGKVGIIDDNMKFIIAIQYDDINYNSTYNAYIVTLNNEYAMIDFENNILIPFTNNNLGIEC